VFVGQTAPSEGAAVSNNAKIERLDHYTLKIDGILVTANADQEKRIREMSQEEIQNFKTIMSGSESS
jgi:hypothetical protein